MFRGDDFSPSLEGLIAALMFPGTMIAWGSFAGPLVAAFHLVIFGLPVALWLGERIRTPAGVLVAMMTGLVAAHVAVRGMWGLPGVSGEPSHWEEAPALSCFVLPATWFYRRRVIAMLDALPA